MSETTPLLTTPSSYHHNAWHPLRSEHEWPGYERVTETIRAANNHLFTDDPATLTAARAILEPYEKNHDEYLGSVASRAEAQARRRKQFTTQAFDARRGSYFAFTDGERPPLDLGALGLPLPELKKHEENLKPLAVIVHDAHQTGGVSGVELVLSDGKAIQSRFLENVPASEDPKTTQTSRWMMPGTALLSRRSVEPMTALTSGRRKSVLHLMSAKQGANETATARIIRQKPTHAEKVVADPYHDRPRGRLRRAVGTLFAVAAAGAALSFSPEAPDPEKNRTIATAAEMVLPAGSKTQNGVAQAEQHFKEPELSRARAAFEAYFRGDSEELKRQAASQGFESNWMKPEAIAAVEKAQTYDELQEAFRRAVDGLPASFTALTTKSSLLGLDEAFEHSPASSFRNAKQYALDALQFLNVFDKSQLLEDMEPLEYIVVGDIKDKASIDDPHGYYMQTEDGSKSKIVLSDRGFTGATAIHESGHYLDLSKHTTGVTSGVVSQLNPKSHSYTGHQGLWIVSGTVVEGHHTTAEPYGNATALEDTATAGEEVLAPDPKLRWSHSPLGEKQAALIFELEKKYPGFTASLLLRTETAKPFLGKWDEALLHEVQQQKFPLGGIALLTLAALGGNWLRNVGSRSVMRSHGYLTESKS